MQVSRKSWHWRIYSGLEYDGEPSICKYVGVVGFLAPILGVIFVVLCLPIFLIAKPIAALAEWLGSLGWRMPRIAIHCPLGKITPKD